MVRELTLVKVYGARGLATELAGRQGT